MAVPTVTGLDPASGPEGTMVLITGTDFLEDASKVVFGSYDCGLNYTVISDTAITCIVPAGSGTQTVKVTTSGGTNSSGASFTYAAYEGGTGNIPVVSSVVPDQSAGYDGQGGDSVAIGGSGFTTARAVYFGETLATAIQAPDFTINSDSSITATAPSGEPGTTVYVYVENDFGTSIDEDTGNDFEYQGSGVPTVTELRPASGFPGDEIVVIGTGFDDAIEVPFGTLYAGFFIDSDTSMRVIVPGDSSFVGTSVDVYVANQWGVSTSYATFTYGTVVEKILSTAISLDTGDPAPTPNSGWIEAASVNVTLSPTYTGMPSGSVESTWYRLDNGPDLRYSSPFAINTYGSHKVEFWSVGVDGYVEPTNVAYVNLVENTTVSGLTATAAIGAIIYRWSPVTIPGVRYEVYIDTDSDPSTLVAVTTTPNYTHQYSAGAAGVYCKVRAQAPDDTLYAFSNIVGPTQSLQSQTTDLADRAISESKLATSIVPPKIVDELPTLPHPDYPAGTTVFLTTDGKLYKFEGGGINTNAAAVNDEWHDQTDYGGGYGNDGTLANFDFNFRRNIILNPSLEGTYTGGVPPRWQYGNGTAGTPTLTRVTGIGPDSSYAWRVQYTGLAGDGGGGYIYLYIYAFGDDIQTSKAGDYWHCSIMAQGYCDADFGLEPYFIDGNWLWQGAGGQVWPVMDGSPHTAHSTGPLSANCVMPMRGLYYYLTIRNIAEGDNIDITIDDAMAELSDTSGVYFDGETGYWEGTDPVDSTSVYESGWTGAGTPDDPYALTFDGQDDRVDLADTTSLRLNDNVTIEAWVRARSLRDPTTYNPIFAHYNAGAGSYELYLMQSGAIAANFRTTSGANDCATGTGEVEEGTLHHIIVSYYKTTGTVRFWRDGNIVKEQTGLYTDFASASGNNSVGHRGGTLHFHGDIATLRIYGGAGSNAILWDNDSAALHYSLGPHGQGYSKAGLILDLHADAALSAGAWTPVVNTDDLTGQIDFGQLATGLNPVRIIAGPSTPPLPDSEYPVGTILYNISTNTLYKNTDDAQWGALVDAQDIVAGSITGGQIQAGAIGATEIASENIYAKHLFVANYENLIPNPGSEIDPSGYDVTHFGPDIEFRGVHADAAYIGSYGRRVPGAGASAYNVCSLTNYIPVVPGEDYRMEATMCCSTDVAPGYIFIAQQCYDADHGYIGNSAYAGFLNNTTWVDVACQGEILAGSAYMMPLLITYDMATDEYGYFDKLLLRKRGDGNLIVDGTITTYHMLAGTIDADRIIANSITAGQIAAAAIGAEELAAESVFAEHLTVANFENLIPNPNSTLDPTGKTSEQLDPLTGELDFRGVVDPDGDAVIGTYCRMAPGKTGDADYAVVTARIPVEPGTIYHFRGKGRIKSAASAGQGCKVIICSYYPNGTFFENLGTAVNESTTWADMQLDYTVPTGAAFIDVYLASWYISDTNEAYFDQLMLRRKLEGTLLVEGTVTADHVVASIDMTTPVIHSDDAEPHTWQLDENGIYGMTITGGVFQTSGDTDDYRISISDGYMSTIFFTPSGSSWAGDDNRLVGYIDGSSYDCLAMRATPETPGTTAEVSIKRYPGTSLTGVDINGGGYGSVEIDAGYGLNVNTEMHAPEQPGPHYADTILREFDFIAAGSFYAAGWHDEWMFSKLGGSTPSVNTLSDGEHTGVAAFTTGSVVNSGFIAQTAQDTIELQFGDTAEFIFKTPYVTGTNQHFRMGFMNSFSTTNPSAGMWMEATGGYLYLKCHDGTTIRTSSSYALSSTTDWYRIWMWRNSSGYANAYLYLNGSSSYTKWFVMAYNPAGACGHGFVNWSDSSTPQNNLSMDYMNYCLEPRSR